MEKKIEIIAVDFDGTLCSECYPAIGMPNLPLFALLKGARRQGKKVIFVDMPLRGSAGGGGGLVQNVRTGI